MRNRWLGAASKGYGRIARTLIEVSLSRRHHAAVETTITDASNGCQIELGSSELTASRRNSRVRTQRVELLEGFFISGIRVVANENPCSIRLENLVHVSHTFAVYHRKPRR